MTDMDSLKPGNLRRRVKDGEISTRDAYVAIVCAPYQNERFLGWLLRRMRRGL